MFAHDPAASALTLAISPNWLNKKIDEVILLSFGTGTIPSLHPPSLQVKRNWWHGSPSAEIRALQTRLSLPTGTVNHYYEDESHDWGYMQWVPKLAGVLWDGMITHSEQICHELLGDRYFRHAVLSTPTPLPPAHHWHKIAPLTVKVWRHPDAVHHQV
jgi:hypothetical protein